MPTIIPIQKGETIESMVRKARPDASPAEFQRLVAQVLKDNNLEDNGPGSSAWRIPIGKPIDMTAVYGEPTATPLNQAPGAQGGGGDTLGLLEQYLRYQILLQQQQLALQQNPFGFNLNGGFGGPGFGSPGFFNPGFGQGGFNPNDPFGILDNRLGTHDMTVRAAILAGIDPLSARQLAAGLIF